MSRTVGCCAHVAAVLWCLAYQRHQTEGVLKETNYCGAINVLDAADTDWDATCRVNKSLMHEDFIQGASTFVLLFSLSGRLYFHFDPRANL